MVEEQPAQIRYGPPPPVPPRSSHSRERVTSERRSITFDNSALLSVRMADIAGDSDEYDTPVAGYSVPRQSLSACTSSRDVAMRSVDSYEKFNECGDDASLPLSVSNLSLSSKDSKKKNRLSAVDLSDHDSIGSTDSSREPGKLASLFDKAKSRGKKLVTRSKKQKTELIDEGLQVSIDPDAVSEVSVASVARSCTPSISSDSASNGGILDEKTAVKNFLNWSTSFVSVGASDKESERKQSFPQSLATRCRTMPFFRHRMTLLIVLIAVTWIWPSFLLGVIWGVYLSFIGFLYFFVSDPVVPAESKWNPEDFMHDVSNECEKRTKTRLDVVYKGWMNELRGRYSSVTYHVNQAQTVLVRLDGSMLRISRPERAVLKHAFHTDPTLTEPEPKLVGQSIYDLRDAKISLRPRRLAKRRWWSRKYPIYIRLASPNSVLTNSDQKGSAALARSSTDHNVSGGRGIPNAQGISATAEDVRNIRESDEGYDPDESTDDESTQPPANLVRANSTGDLDALADMQAAQSARRYNPTKIYLFVRSAREKERWFHRLRETCSQFRTRPTEKIDLSNLNGVSHAKMGNPIRRARAKLERASSLPDDINLVRSMYLEYFQYLGNHVHFYRYLADVMGAASSEKSMETGTVMMDLGRNKWIQPERPAPNNIVMAVNLLATRIFFDFCRDDYWCRAVRDKIQTKLATIHLPYFIETLELSSLDLGTLAPQIVGVYAPIVDQWGIWTDFEMKYEGGIRLVLETRVNLMKLTNGSTDVAPVKKISRLYKSTNPNHYSDEEIPESPESSPDEDFGSKNKDDKNKTYKEKTGRRILSFVDRLAQSKYFQEAVEFKPVKKMMEGISSTQLRLNVEVTALEGTMTVNIPPPPSDRLWYSFRKPPRISIRAIPQVGDRSVVLTTVSDWIEGKLRILLEKNLVCPNMDDIIIPAMSGNDLLNSGYNK
uniref:SMP-LTD domain-containing protein n=1 Tax=Steinernema glaseri TaxID=37863 RepID=A0A1I7YWS7_9BILA